jgi:hypothetical protein
MYNSQIGYFAENQRPLTPIKATITKKIDFLTLKCIHRRIYEEIHLYLQPFRNESQPNELAIALLN